MPDNWDAFQRREAQQSARLAEEEQRELQDPAWHLCILTPQPLEYEDEGD